MVEVIFTQMPECPCIIGDMMMSLLVPDTVTSSLFASTAHFSCSEEWKQEVAHQTQDAFAINLT